jgi:transcriptional regulator with XRE-family HTH domain
MPEPRTITSLDIHIGKRLRTRRNVRGLSMQDLAALTGISYQQIQKYELGGNRISASRLYQLACLLEVEPAWFFEDFDPEGDRRNPAPDPPADWLRLWRLIEPLPEDVRHAYLEFGKNLARTVPGTKDDNAS